MCSENGLTMVKSFHSFSQKKEGVDMPMVHEKGQNRLRGKIETVRNMILNTSVEGFCACAATIQKTRMLDAIGGIPTRMLI